MFATPLIRGYRAVSTVRATFRTVRLTMASSAANAGPIESNGAKKRPYSGKTHYRFKNKKQKASGDAELKSTGSHEEVLLADVRALLKKVSLNSATEENGASESAISELPEHHAELDLTISELSSTGDGLALSPDSKHVYVVPFTAPGDVAKARVFKHFKDEGYSLTDFVSIQKASPHRDDSLVKCPYFTTCSGCQFQMLPYQYQLDHKKRIVEKAYANFSNLDPALLPPIGDTIGSPLQYGYRTKLTPHFDGPPGAKRSDGRHGIQRGFEEVPPIGFMKKNTRTTMDIEDCPIGTPAVRLGVKRERARVAEQLSTFKRGATLLLRESTARLAKDSPEAAAAAADPDTVVEERPDDPAHVYAKTCITDPKGTSTEYIGNWVFTNPAGAFFQNNNSILTPFTEYIRQHILPPANPSDPSQPRITHLIDAYSGSGLFTITLSPLFASSQGIDIAASSIASARANAAANALSPSHASFVAADAAHLFASITSPANETVVVIDPPRKGCDASFLRQLLEYAPRRVLYVSCNVHTQARDVGILVGGMKGVGEGRYEVESLCGFDFFPQTGHVEGVAVLRRRDDAKVATEGVKGEEGEEKVEVQTGAQVVGEEKTEVQA